ncbi:MAG TPA: nitrilase-related carbon-nitrogen hydrolase [Anaerolineae bacterium]|nr:nitrilase-related carbon-nitrogen hydrolase [Anaerolineae bacterium]
MENLIVACIQQRMSIQSSHEEFDTEVRRFLRQAQAKAARLVVFPELTGVMLAPPLISSFKLGFLRQKDQAKQPGAGFLSRTLGRVAGGTAGALGGGFWGSLGRLVHKRSDALRDAYVATFSALAREYGTAIVAGSLYLYDEETGTVRNRAYLFDVDGEVLGYQDKLNLTPGEGDLAGPGSEIEVFRTRHARLGLLIGRDALYPELARALAVQGAEVIVGLAACPGVAQGRAVRSALAMRAEENQLFVAGSFLLGPDHLGRDVQEDFYGQSALLSPISLSPRGDGILVQAGTDRTEGIIAAELDGQALSQLQATSRFRPRSEMHLGNAGAILAEMYRDGLTIEQAIEQRVGGPAYAPPPEVPSFVRRETPPEEPPEPLAEEEAPVEELPWRVEGAGDEDTESE